MASGKRKRCKKLQIVKKKKALDAAIAKLEKDFGSGCSDEAGRSGGTCVSRDGSDWMPESGSCTGTGGVPKEE